MQNGWTQQRSQFRLMFSNKKHSTLGLFFCFSASLFWNMVNVSSLSAARSLLYLTATHWYWCWTMSQSLCRFIRLYWDGMGGHRRRHVCVSVCWEQLVWNLLSKYTENHVLSLFGFSFAARTLSEIGLFNPMQKKWLIFVTCERGPESLKQSFCLSLLKLHTCICWIPATTWTGANFYVGAKVEKGFTPAAKAIP